MEFVLYSIVAFCFLVICFLLLRMNRANKPKGKAVKQSAPKVKKKIPDYNWGCIIYLVIVLAIAITEISGCFFRDTQSTSSTVPETDTTSIAEVSKEKTVYWVANGKVWHVTRNCSTLARSNNIYSGTVQQSGKSRVCDVCG